MDGLLTFQQGSDGTMKKTETNNIVMIHGNCLSVVAIRDVKRHAGTDKMFWDTPQGFIELSKQDIEELSKIPDYESSKKE
jgi:hypothetical protein